MPLVLPVNRLLLFIGFSLIASTVMNALLLKSDASFWGHDLYSEGYFVWSALVIFFAIMLIFIGFHWNDPRVNFILAGIIAVLWYVYIVLEG